MHTYFACTFAFTNAIANHGVFTSFKLVTTTKQNKNRRTPCQ